jgi:hypothetical protein
VGYELAFASRCHRPISKYLAAAELSLSLSVPLATHDTTAIISVTSRAAQIAAINLKERMCRNSIGNTPLNVQHAGTLNIVQIPQR